jgi:hypothetical protein
VGLMKQQPIAQRQAFPAPLSGPSAARAAGAPSVYNATFFCTNDGLKCYRWPSAAGGMTYSNADAYCSTTFGGTLAAFDKQAEYEEFMWLWLSNGGTHWPYSSAAGAVWWIGLTQTGGKWVNTHDMPVATFTSHFVGNSTLAFVHWTFKTWNPSNNPKL